MVGGGEWKGKKGKQKYLAANLYVFSVVCGGRGELNLGFLLLLLLGAARALRGRERMGRGACPAKQNKSSTAPTDLVSVGSEVGWRRNKVFSCYGLIW